MKVFIYKIVIIFVCSREIVGLEPTLPGTSCWDFLPYPVTSFLLNFEVTQDFSYVFSADTASPSLNTWLLFREKFLLNLTSVFNDYSSSFRQIQSILLLLSAKLETFK